MGAETRTMELRQEHRYRVWEPVRVLLGEGADERELLGDLVDISKSGLCFTAGEEVSRGTHIHVTVRHLSVFAIVSRCNSNSRGTYSVGAEITSIEVVGANRAEAQAKKRPRPLSTSVTIH